MFLRVGSCVTVTMIRFSTRIKSLHIWGIFSSRVWRRFDKLACALKSLFGLCLFINDGASTSNKELDGFNNSFDTSKIRWSRHAWPWPRHTQSDWVRVFKTETEIGTPARVEAETWKFARQRGSSRALGTRGLYVLWNYYAANSHAATPAPRRQRSWRLSACLFLWQWC